MTSSPRPPVNRSRAAFESRSARHGRAARVVAIAGLALAALVASIARADSLSEIFERANAAYFRGDYDRAATEYRRLGELGVIDADVSYDLATAEARRGRYGAAIQHFERALWLSPGDEDARAGLDAARAAVGGRRADTQGVADVESAPPLSDALFGGISRETFAIATLALDVVFFGALIGLLFVTKESARLALGITAPLAFVLLALSAFGLAIANGWLEEGEPAVVLEEHVALREGPDPRATERHRAVEGQRAWILEEDRGWVRVRVPSLGEGWAEDAHIGRVRP